MCETGPRTVQTNAMKSDLKEYLQQSPTLDFQDPDVTEFAYKYGGCSEDPVKKAIRLYYAVRDKIRYDPYTIDMTVDGLRASATLSQGRGWCVTKSILLAALCRRLGIPARLGFADVYNHLSTERMRRLMNTDVFFWHGYTAIYLNCRWLKATPAFNIELCERFRIRPLDFDGGEDSIFHPFDLEGRTHMEYIRFRGEYTEPPIADIHQTFVQEYGMDSTWNSSDFNKEVVQETRTA